MKLKFAAASRFAGVLSVLFVLAAAPLFAEGPYLPAGKPDALTLLPPPPAATSPEQAADLASALQIFNSRTPQDEAVAKSEENFSVYCFAPVVGTNLQAGRFPKLDALFDEVAKEAKAVGNVPKNHWQRPRPFEADPRLLFGAPEKGFSYPSGHSTLGTVDALLLADLFPEKKEAILEAGRAAGWHRIETGKHYPTDVYAGRVLGQAIVNELKTSPAFEHDFAEVKTETALANQASPTR